MNPSRLGRSLILPVIRRRGLYWCTGRSPPNRPFQVERDRSGSRVLRDHDHADAASRRTAARCRSEPDRTRPDVASPPPEPPRSVLLIEPSPDECARLRDVLTAGGLAVHACADLAAAEDAMASVHPGVILARRELSSGSGLELVHRRDEEPAAGWVPVILHGGRATAEERIAALDLGAFDVLGALARRRRAAGAAPRRDAGPRAGWIAWRSARIAMA